MDLPFVFTWIACYIHMVLSVIFSWFCPLCSHRFICYIHMALSVIFTGFYLLYSYSLYSNFDSLYSYLYAFYIPIVLTFIITYFCRLYSHDYSMSVLFNFFCMLYSIYTIMSIPLVYLRDFFRRFFYTEHIFTADVILYSSQSYGGVTCLYSSNM